MNSVYTCKACLLKKLIDSNDDVQMHLLLESMHLSVDVQDRIINAAYSLHSVTPGKLAMILEHCDHSLFPERLLH